MAVPHPNFTHTATLTVTLTVTLTMTLTVTLTVTLIVTLTSGRPRRRQVCDCEQLSIRSVQRAEQVASARVAPIG